MKFSMSLALALAPLSLARNVRNTYPVNAVRRGGHDGQGGDGTVVFVDGSNGDDKMESKDDKGKDNNKDNNKDKQWYDGINVNSKTEIIVIWVNPGNNAETTTVNEKVTVTQTVTAGGAETAAPAAASHTVTVGGPAGLVFTPDQLNDVPVGDTVIFEFYSQNHTVTQSGFDTPCVAMEGGMDSSFMPNPNNTVSPPPQVAMQVMAESPLWFYCKQGNHCGSGMTFSINPTAEKTQAMFQQMAIAQNGTGDSTPITGGDGGSAGDDAAATTAATTAAETAVETATATTEAGADATGGVTPGQGTIGADGSCSCFVSCSAGSFPADTQGIGARGGMPGSLPMNMVGIS